MKKIISVLLAAVMAFSVFSVALTAYAKDVNVPSSGVCGEKVGFTFDKKKGILTISGKGDMFDYDPLHVGGEVSPFCRNKKVKEIVIKNGVTLIGDGAFLYCYGLKKITIPKSVKSIGAHAFQSCKKLETLKIPNTVKFIDAEAFSDCDSLKSIVLPCNMKKISRRLFFSCEKLESVQLPEMLKVISDYAFLDCKSLKKLELPDGLEEIKGGAFSETGIRKMVFPDTVRKLGSLLFYNSKGIYELVIPGTVKEISDMAFYECSVKSVKLCEGIEVIPSKCFAGCSKLKQVSLPSTLKTIYSLAFAGCNNIKKMYFCGTFEQYYNRIEIINETGDDEYSLDTEEPKIYDVVKGKRQYSNCYGFTESPEFESVTSGKGKIYVRLKRNADADGYQIQYSTEPSFKPFRRRTIKNLRKKLPKLQRKKTYYVRVRTYVNRSDQKDYSPWSETVVIKTK